MDKNKIGVELKKYREKAGMSMSELAEAAGLNSKDVIYKYESGKRIPTLEKNLPKICEVLGVEFDIVFKPIKKK